MTDVAMLMDVKFGLHTDAQTFDNTPGTVSIIECFSIDGVLPRERKALDRALYSADGNKFVPFFGVKNVDDPIGPKMTYRGVDSNSDGGAFTPQTSMEQCRMLDSAFGTAAAAIAGAAVTATGGGGGTTDLTASGTTLADGDHVLLTSSSGVFAREIVSGGGTGVLVVDRTTPGTLSGNIVRAARHNSGPTTTHHIHGYFRAEGESWRRDYFGCFCEQVVLDASKIGEYVGFESVWRPTDWTDVAEANPTYAAPTAGSPIVVADSPFWIGNTEFLLESAKITMKWPPRPRKVTTGANGIHGYVSMLPEFMIEGDLLLGSNPGSIGELVDGSGTPTLGALTGDDGNAAVVQTTYDIALQLGNAAGAALYARMPAAALRGQVVESDGAPVYRFQAFATRPSSGAAFRLGTF